MINDEAFEGMERLLSEYKGMVRSYEKTGCDVNSLDEYYRAAIEEEKYSQKKIDDAESRFIGNLKKEIIGDAFGKAFELLWQKNTAPDTQTPESVQTKPAKADGTPPPLGGKKRAYTEDGAIDFLINKKQLIAPKCPTEMGTFCLDKWDGKTYLPKRKRKKQEICRVLYEQFPDWTFCKEFIANHLPNLDADFVTFKSKTLKDMKKSEVF